MALTGPQKYPGASTAYWYGTKYPGSAMDSNVIVWHSTEGTSLPAYSGGSEAPNFTAKPDFAVKKLVWHQHFDFDVSSRALVNAAGGVQTNTLNVCQVEIVGTCDPTTHKKWGTTPHLYMPELPDWAIRDLAAFAKWAHTNHGVPLTSGVIFKAYPGSYGASNGVRMTGTKWQSYTGHCGHQHVPENLHGDPGLLPITAILTAAQSGTTSTQTVKETSVAGFDLDDLKFLATKDGVFTAPTDAADYDPDPAKPGHYWSLGTHIAGLTAKVRAMEKRLAAMDAKLDAILAAKES
ncbi:hypothetical protein [Streptomyces sp. NPDC008150]|uniref:hypothetical protein n=1 Tax=Streptomyces sp. NPDC008150 TaxID=3364816 RepID=UPI0036E73829